MKRVSSPASDSPPAKAIAAAATTMDVADSPTSPPAAERGPALSSGLPEWVVVSRRRAAKPAVRPGLQPLPLGNFFKTLPVQETPGAKVPSARPSQARPTPIIINTEKGFNLSHCRAALKAAGVANFSFNVKPHSAHLSIPTKSEKDLAIPVLKAQSGLQFHSFTDKYDRDHVSVVHGLYYSSVEELTEALKALGFAPTKVVAFKGGELTPPRYQVTLPKSTDIGAFRKIRKILDQTVRITKYISNNKFGTMCSRCQFFGHAARNCNRAPRCVKCLGEHITADCTKSAEAVVRCCNCGGEHAASYRQCPQRQMYLAAVQERKERYSRQHTHTHKYTPAPPRPFPANGRGWGPVPGAAPPPMSAHMAPPPPTSGPQPKATPPSAGHFNNNRSDFPGLKPTGPIPNFSRSTEKSNPKPGPTAASDDDCPSFEETIRLIQLAGELRPLLRRSMPLEQQLVTVLGFLERFNA